MKSYKHDKDNDIANMYVALVATLDDEQLRKFQSVFVWLKAGSGSTVDDDCSGSFELGLKLRAKTNEIVESLRETYDKYLKK